MEKEIRPILTSNRIWSMALKIPFLYISLPFSGSDNIQILRKD